MIKEITKYISTGVPLILDKEIFAGFRPSDSQARCVVVLEPVGGSVNSYFPDSGSKVIQILSRAETFWQAREDINKVFDFLKSKAQVTLPTVDVGVMYKAEFIEAQNFPQSLQQDEEGRWEFSANFIFRIRLM